MAELGIKRWSRVLDIGAGTGKLTRQLVSQGVAVVGIEPLRAMCVQFRGAVDAPIAQAVAEAIPVRSQSADAVVVAQAFHWFDFEPTLSEFHRVLRPGGGLALIWNMRDERTDWVARLGDIRRRYGDIRYDTGKWRRPLASSGLFGDLVERQFWHEQVLDPTGVVELMASRSFIAALPFDENQSVREEVRQLLSDHPDTRGREQLVVPYRTDVYVTTRTPT
ncbi:MAG: methyltransferase domain-containing protein [Actinomycetota bacterium]|nr:methyltransferase domain-containing protein [Actinomycetota bacterium]